MTSSYPEHINSLLRPKAGGPFGLIDLFAGCGGLALGFEAQAFATHGWEMNPDACATYRSNLGAECTHAVLTTSTALPRTNVLVGGPPCQPFSVVGHQLGIKDSRDGFPIFISAVEKVQPDLWMFENVRGLFYRNRWYLDEIIQALEELAYIVELKLLNAADYGVPQNRERVVVVGHRGKFKYPERQRKRVTAGEALCDLATTVPSDSKFLTASMDDYVARYEAKSKCIRPRDLHMERPARTLTCRNLAGATADMMRVRLPDGRRRRLLEREAARLQSFPDWFDFEGGETSRFDQIGNAVPPLLGFALASSVREYLESDFRLSKREIVSRRRPAQTAMFG